MKSKTKYYGAAFKIVRVAEPSFSSIKIDTPQSVSGVWHAILRENPIIDSDKENLLVMTVNTRMVMTGYSLVSVGTLNESLAHPRDILRPVIVAGAYGFILVHNHPSGDTSPSEADRRLTRRIKEGAELLQIPFLDHVIVSLGEAAYSFRARGKASMKSYEKNT